jgi:hypothetical protein
MGDDRHGEIEDHGASFATADGDHGRRSESELPGPPLPINRKILDGLEKRQGNFLGDDEDEIEDDLLAADPVSGDDIRNDSDHTRKENKERNDNDASEYRESEGEEPRSDDMSQKGESDIGKRRKQKSHKKRGDRKGKEPVRPAGFVALMSSISCAGRNETISRNEPAGATTAIPLKRGRKEIPTGMQLNKVNENEGRGRARGHWGQGYLDFGGNMLSTLQALRHFAWHLPSRNILFTFGM